jgi:hypothetical protein
VRRSVVAQDGVLALKEIAEAHKRQAGERGEGHEVAQLARVLPQQGGEGRRADQGDAERRVAKLQGGWRKLHG